MCMYLSVWKLFFFSFTTKIKIILKFFVDPTKMINKSNIFFKIKKKNDLEKEKRSVGFEPTSNPLGLHSQYECVCVCI